MTARLSHRLTVSLSTVLVVALLGTGVAWSSTLSVASERLTVYRTCLLTATAGTSTALFDAWVDQNAPTTVPAVTALDVSSSSNKNQRTYIRFDLSKCGPVIPASASVKQALLRLYGGTPPNACRTHDLFTVNSAWNEATLTWNNQPFGTSINNPAQALRKSTQAIGTTAGCQNMTGGYGTGWDVTSDVSAFVAGTATNNGWMIRDDVEGSSSARLEQYGSKSSGSVTAAPQLLVTYST